MGKTRNIRSVFPLKDKNGYKSYVIFKRDYSWGTRYIGETKRNVEVSSIIQLKVQNHRHTEAMSTTVLHGLSIQMLHKLDMVSHRAINDIMQTPLEEVHVLFFSVCCIVFDSS